jgi:hypothetical protein
MIEDQKAGYWRRIMRNDIADNVHRARERIAKACARAGRSAADVTIVAVTKTQPADAIEQLLAAGVADIGENRIQEFLEKAPRVAGPCRWHLVGALQSNKVPKTIGRFDLIHSVDRMKIAEGLSAAGRSRDVTTRILLEVNTSQESTKHGFLSEETLEAAAKIIALPNLDFEGLMTIGPLTDDATVIRRAFQSLFRLRDEAERSLAHPLRHLSMGMSDDFEIAVEEGATLVRLGRVLLGERRP